MGWYLFLFAFLLPLSIPLQHFLGDVEKLIISLKSINTDCKNKNNNKQFATCQPGYLKKVRFGFTLKCRSVDQWRTKRDTRNSKNLTKSNAAASAAATCHMNLKLSRCSYSAATALEMPLLLAVIVTCCCSI